MYTLGINAAFHDSAACLVRDGVVVAAAEDERFTHVKHGKRPVPFTAYELPYHAIEYCLSPQNLSLGDIDQFAYGYDPRILLGSHEKEQSISLPLEPSRYPRSNGWTNVWDPYFLAAIVNAPRLLVDGAPFRLKKRFSGLSIEEAIKRWRWIDHHTAHAASAFLASPYTHAAILTLDGRGEKTTTSYARGRGNSMTRIGGTEFPHSFGLLYEQVTSYLGFLHSSDEYKVMALASFGKPRFIDTFRDMVRLGTNGSYLIKQTNLEELFGPARPNGSAFSQRHYDIAKSLQTLLEEDVLVIADWLHDQTHEDTLCMAGGVALNCVLNSRIRDAGAFKHIWVQPAAGDAGTALGAALYADMDARRTGKRAYTMDTAYLGPEFSDTEIEQFLAWTKVPYKKVADIAKTGADLLTRDKVVAWFQGRMEFGPRALGARSILASPVHASMQAKLNNIKDREDFRPVAPVVTEEDAPRYFAGASYSPYMLFVYDVKKGMQDRIPAVRHIDGTARIQTVNKKQNKEYYRLLKAFETITGVPVLVNTSFNTRGEPIVCTPRDALECYWTSPIDALVIGHYVLEKQH